jgi:2-dehydro-3-deoxyphosphooctonate aldolase (KDO 8-P synthase)
MQNIYVKDFIIGKNQPLTFICGPCVIEDEALAIDAAIFLKSLFLKYEVNFIYKSSFDKANRSSISSYRGPGIKKGLKILEKIKSKFDLPIISDVHSVDDVEMASNVCDILQIPAFLCRQTDLLTKSAKTGCVINVKKGQFVSPMEMKNTINKVLSCDNNQIILTERGTTFGYNNLISDMRSIPIMQSFGYPVCFDASHSVQMPGGEKTISGGDTKFIPYLAKAALAVGANALFIEAHPDPKNALCDSFSQMSFNNLEEHVKNFIEIYDVINKKALV